MNQFIYKTALIKKFFIGMILAVLLLLGLGVWSINQDAIRNFRWYYLKPYFHIISEKYSSPEIFASSAILTSTTSQDKSGAEFVAPVAQSVPVITYHGILDTSDGLNESLDNFMDQMYVLKRAGWQTVTIAEFVDFMKGKRTLPDRSFVLAFDDGRRDSYYPADPILRDLGYTAVMYVITSRSLVDDRKVAFHLSQSELNMLDRSGRWELQSHGKNDHDLYQIEPDGKLEHFMSNKLWLPEFDRHETDYEYEHRILEDLIVSRDELVSAFGKPVKTYAFPFGDYGQEQNNFSGAKDIIISSIKKVYDVGLYSVWPSQGGSFNYPTLDLPLTKRIDVLPEWNGKDLLKKLEAGKAKVLPFIQSSDFGQEWLPSWGSVQLGNTLKLSIHDGADGAAVFLDGSYLFQDYYFFTKTKILSDGRMSLVVLRLDNNNYISCSFSKNKATIEKWSDGNQETIAQNLERFELPVSSVWIGASAADSVVKCFAGNKLVASARVDAGFTTGGIGVKLWQPASEQRTVEVDEVRVGRNKQLGEFIQTLPNYSVTQTIPSPLLVEKIVPNKITSSVQKVEVEKENFTPVVIPLVDPSGNFINYQMTHFTQAAPWVSRYGNLGIFDGKLETGSVVDKGASLITLSGSEQWTNYEFNIVADWHVGKSLGLVARYHDIKNYAACSYSLYGTYVRAYYVLNGVEVELGSSPRLPTPYFMPWQDRSSAIRVVGNKLTCLMNGEEILNYSLPALLSTGGIGIKTWDPAISTKFRIKTVLVEPKAN